MTDRTKYPRKDRGFHVCHEASYAKACKIRLPELMVGYYPADGGTTGEFGIRWREVGGRLAARLEVFDEAWGALAHCNDLLSRLSALDGSRPGPDQVVQILKDLGFRDLTQREPPKYMSTREREAYEANGRG